MLPSAGVADEESMKLIVSAYVSVLTRYPLWAVNAGCRAYLSGELSNNGFAPSPPLLADAARKAVAPFLAEFAQLDAILDADVYEDPTPESLARAGLAEAAIAKVAAARVAFAEKHWDQGARVELTGGSIADPEAEKREAGKRLDAMRMNPQPVTIGSTLAAKLPSIKASIEEEERRHGNPKTE